jgi:hypothetical protein
MGREVDKYGGVTRARAALGLHVVGATDAQIADELGFTGAVEARRAWEAAIADTLSEGDLEMVRRVEARRLDDLQSAVMDEALDPGRVDQKGAIKTVLAIMQRRADMLGLDRPTKVEVYSPTLAELNEVASSMLERLGVTSDVEAEDVLDAEEVVDAG